ncbi:MAG: GlcG/HbpS family heme-binding protein [Acidobacteriota bacterium]
MLRLGLMAAALCLALVTHSAAFAQAPENPNDAVPDAMPFDVPYGEPIDLATAKKVAAAAVAEAQKHGNWKMNIAIVGPSGDLLYFERMDGAQLASVAISQHKARVSARYRRPTLAFEQGMGRGQFFTYLGTLDDIVASRGGNPLVVNGKLIGAIGVSGGTGSQDDVVSKAGVAALGK